MKCVEIQELLGTYWDLPKEDIRRLQVDEHIRRCMSCKEEFEIWQESTHLIQNLRLGPLQPKEPVKVSKQVMNRIYTDESWRIPVANRAYSISYKMRRNVSAVLAFCLTLFIFSFVYSVVFVPPAEEAYTFNNSTGLLPVANALGENSTSAEHIQGVPIASISDPLIIHMGIIKTYPDYLVVISLLGIISLLLTLNWLSRIRA
jgi:hypothetical protein